MVISSSPSHARHQFSWELVSLHLPEAAVPFDQCLVLCNRPSFDIVFAGVPSPYSAVARQAIKVLITCTATLPFAPADHRTGGSAWRAREITGISAPISELSRE
jgi:hypothetical protein